MIRNIKSKVFNKQNLLIFISLLLITFFICMLSPLDIFSFNGLSSTDSSVFKYIGWMMNEGQIPYVDIFDHKGLLIYFINYFGYLLSPHRGVWIFEFIFMFLTVLFLYKIARKFLNKPFSILTILIVLAPLYTYFEGGNFTEEYAMPFQVIALYIFLDFFINPDKYMNDNHLHKQRGNFKLFNLNVFICGLCFAGVLFLRPNMISVWAVFTIMVLIYCIYNKKYIEIDKFLLSFILGMLVIFIPMLVYLFLNNAFQSFVNAYILFNINYSAYNNLSDIINSFKVFFNTPITFMSFLIIIIKIYNQAKNKENIFFNVGYLVCMFITIVLVSMSGFEFPHYGMTMIPMFIYPFSLLFIYIKQLTNNDLRLILTVLSIMMFVIPNWPNIILEGCSEMANKYSDTFDSSTVNYIKKNTNKDDLITVVGNHNIIYNFSERKSASKYSYQQPLIFMDDKMYKEYFKDIENNKPKIISQCLDLDQNSNFANDLNKFIEKNNYKLVFEGECDVYER